MQAITIGTILEGSGDAESTRYKILSALKEARSHFRRNEIYPDLRELISSFTALSQLRNALTTATEHFPREIIGLDVAMGRILYADASYTDERFSTIREVLDWAIPLLRDTIEEGKTVYEFIEDHLHISIVGILPRYYREGYLFITNLQNRQLHLFRYELSVYSGEQEDSKQRILKTTLVKTIDQNDIHTDLQSTKLLLVKEFPDLPNPATYSLTADIDVPFEATLLPIAKRKLLTYLHTIHH